MAGFDEAWLRAYQAKQVRPPAALSTQLWPLTIALVRPIAYRVGNREYRQNNLPLLNSWQRWHWTRRRAYQAALSAELATLIPPVLSRPVLQRALVTVTRYSTGRPDQDGCIVKPLLDCLLVRSDRHPHGLGLIADDDPEHLSMPPVRAVVCEHQAEQRTEITIEPA